MKRMLISAMIAGGLAVGVARAPSFAAGPTTAPSATIEQLLARLGDDDPVTRQAGQDNLVLLGHDAVDPLKQFIATAADVEQRTSAETALARIQELSAIGPTLVTLHLVNASHQFAVTELARVSGAPIKFQSGEANGQPMPPVTLDIDHEPLWQALRKICVATGRNVQCNGRGESLLIGPDGYDISGPAVIDGPFMIVASSINMNSNVQLNQPANINRSESIEFNCFAEPKLHLTEHPYNVKLTQATDDTGKSLLVPAQDDGFEENYNTDGQPVWQANTNLVVPDAPAKKIKHLAGRIRLQAATKIENIEIDDIMTAKNASKSVGPQTVMVKNISQVADEITLNVALSAPANSGNLLYSMAQSIQLFDANGVALENENANGDGGNPTRMDFHITFNKHSTATDETKAGDPVKLVLPVVIESKPIECDFKFDDLPLP